ncbi:MAG: ABC transporter ATP-binding protein [Deltaproteobacteria bacterium]|nr:ABC transporter ATP-binding protein [Deltaproteobacteria bacterium]
MNAVSVSGLVKVYGGALGRGGHRALDGVSLTIPRRTAFGLVGPNGAGKTTLVKALLDIVRPSDGRVELFGVPPSDPRVRARVGYLPERLHLPPRWTASAFLASVGRLRGVPKRAEAVARELARVGLGGVGARPVGDFSKGMKQRLGLAAALLGRPELLILDEPTDGIDPLGRVEVRGILREELARGATVLLNSHLLSETERVCDHVGILAGGRVLASGPLRELCGSSSAYRIRLAAPLEADVEKELGLSRAEEPGVVRAEAATPALLNALIDRLRARGAELVELRPDLRTLEELLAELVGGDRR